MPLNKEEAYFSFFIIFILILAKSQVQNTYQQILQMPHNRNTL